MNLTIKDFIMRRRHLKKKDIILFLQMMFLRLQKKERVLMEKQGQMN